MKFVEAQRIRNLPPYLFARIEKLIAAKKEAGVDVISLGIGDPDRPTPVHIIETLVREANNPANHQYPSSVGMLTYRQAVARWYQNRFGIELDPETEVVSLLGSKEGIAHISWCYLNPGDTVAHFHSQSGKINSPQFLLQTVNQNKVITKPLYLRKPQFYSPHAVLHLYSITIAHKYLYFKIHYFLTDPFHQAAGQDSNDCRRRSDAQDQHPVLSP